MNLFVTTYQLSEKRKQICILCVPQVKYNLFSQEAGECLVLSFSINLAFLPPLEPPQSLVSKSYLEQRELGYHKSIPGGIIITIFGLFLLF